jgi:hypothetical protein
MCFTFNILSSSSKERRKTGGKANEKMDEEETQ